LFSYPYSRTILDTILKFKIYVKANNLNIIYKRKKKSRTAVHL